jgi:sugar phosphate permease
VLAGDGVARLAVAFGWDGVFVTLAIVSGAAALCAGVLHVLNARVVTGVQHA